MRFKRAGAAVLAAALSATSMGVYAYADEDATMKKELTYVKQRIDIPEDLTEFSYRTNTENKSTKYTFVWSRDGSKSDKETKSRISSIQVSITGNVIKNVYIGYDYPDEESENLWGSSFAKLSDKKIYAAAKKYIKQLNPTIYKNVEINGIETLYTPLWGNDAIVSFHRVVNGVPVTNQEGSITVDKNTGELIRYDFNWINGATFSDTKDAIPAADAEKAYKELFPVELVYTLQYDWKEDKYTPHLVYRQTKSGQINAFTGELSTFDDYRSYGDAGDEDGELEDDDADDIAVETAADANPGTGAASKAVTFSESELEKLEQESKLIKADAALKKLQDMNIFYIPTQSTVQYQYCYYNERQGYYVRNVQFTGSMAKYIDLNGSGEVVPVSAKVGSDDDEYTVYGNFSINAETGDVLNFYSYAPDNGTNMELDETTSRAGKVMETLLGEKFKSDFGELTNNYSNKVYTKYDSKTGKPIGDPRYTSMSFKADRVAYGITCVGENANLTIANNGFVTNYSTNYHSDIEYPKPEKILSEKKAYTKFFEQSPIVLKYRCAYRTDTKKVVTTLVYDTDNTMYIDAFTGKLTNYNGIPIEEETKTGTYTDIENSSYKKYAEKLAKYGITLMDKDGKLNEDEAVTAQDFVDLLNSAGVNSSYPIGLKNDDKLDRKTAAKMLVQGEYNSKVADMTSIFKTKFSDVKEGDPYIGYIAISDAAGFITGNKNGTFEPDAAFTRGEAIKFVYKQLSK